jgi:hypothetical protein
LTFSFTGIASSEVVAARLGRGILRWTPGGADS